MFCIEKITTGCVILPQIWKKIFFSLVFKKIDLPTSVQKSKRRSTNEKIDSVGIRHLTFWLKRVCKWL
jgi:hypothetical protein